jgi:hypothetical protein
MACRLSGVDKNRVAPVAYSRRADGESGAEIELDGSWQTGMAEIMTANFSG